MTERHGNLQLASAGMDLAEGCSTTKSGAVREAESYSVVEAETS